MPHPDTIMTDFRIKYFILLILPLDIRHKHRSILLGTLVHIFPIILLFATRPQLRPHIVEKPAVENTTHGYLAASIKQPC